MKMKTLLQDVYTFSQVIKYFIAFIIRRGKIGVYLKELLSDMRELMYPYTALKLKESKKNTIKDFLGVSGTYGVTHMLLFT